MKAILVKSLPTTNTKPARLVATDEGGHEIIVTRHDFNSTARAFAPAAIALAEQLVWSGTLIAGSLPDGSYCFVFADYDSFDIV